MLQVVVDDDDGGSYDDDDDDDDDDKDDNDDDLMMMFMIMIQLLLKTTTCRCRVRVLWSRCLLNIISTWSQILSISKMIKMKKFKVIQSCRAEPRNLIRLHKL